MFFKIIIQQVPLEHEPWGGSFSRRKVPPAIPLPCRPPVGETVRARTEQSCGGGKAKPLARGHADRSVGSTACLPWVLRYSTRPRLAQSRCSVNVPRKDGGHWTLTGSYTVPADTNRQDRRRRGGCRPRTPCRGVDSGPGPAAAAATPSGHHVDLKPTPPPGSCPSPPIGRGRPHLCPIEWLLPESELGIGPSAVSLRAARDVRSVWRPPPLLCLDWS